MGSLLRSKNREGADERGDSFLRPIAWALRKYTIHFTEEKNMIMLFRIKSTAIQIIAYVYLRSYFLIWGFQFAL